MNPRPVYMLDTNTVSHAIRGHSKVLRRLSAIPMSQFCISAITEVELRFGLARRPEARRLKSLVEELLVRATVCSWDSAIAQRYASIRAGLERQGTPLAPLDLLITAHALGMGAVAVTNDRAFRHIKDLRVEDWTSPL